MSKVIPTTKTCNEICRMITGYDCDCDHKYVKTTFDPVFTHALYGVVKSEVDYYKDKIKSIGGKYIRVVSTQWKGFKIICFALEITPQEALEVKMAKEKEERFQKAYESKLVEIQTSIILNEIGATNPTAQSNFARYLINGDLDPLLPFESYAFMVEPTDKDEQRIYDIVKKANANCQGCVGMVTRNIYKMIDLAKQMNGKITNEEKRIRRKAACLKYGLNFLAKCFEKTA